jgi:hypothetical protein
MENKWRALRYGIDGKLIDFGKRVEVPMHDLMDEYFDIIDDVVDELGSRDEINYIREILKNGTGADRQLRVWHETGDLKKVVDYIIEETEAGIYETEGRQAAARLPTHCGKWPSSPNWSRGRATPSASACACSLKKKSR